MPRTSPADDPSETLAANVRQLREARGLTQAALGERAGIPRATLSLLESGEGNPTLHVMTSVARALDVRMDELLGHQGSDARMFRRDELPVRQRGCVRVRTLLPDPVEGLDLEQFILPPGQTLTGVPHTPGTKEYLTVERGTVELRVAGKLFRLKEGDVAVFRGHQRHSYTNPTRQVARAYSVVAFATWESYRRTPGRPA